MNKVAQNVPNISQKKWHALLRLTVKKNRKSPNSWRICGQENTARLWTSIVAEFSEFVEL